MPAPYDLTLYSFADTHGAERPFTTRDEVIAYLYARRHGLTILRNVYEFADSRTVDCFLPGVTPGVIRDV